MKGLITWCCWCRVTEFSYVTFRAIANTWHLTESKLSGAAFQTFGLVTHISFPAFGAGTLVGNGTESIDHALHGAVGYFTTVT